MSNYPSPAIDSTPTATAGPCRVAWPHRRIAGLAAALIACVAPLGLAHAQDALSGERQVLLHGREGKPLRLGTVRFDPESGDRSRFTLALDHGVFKDFFLSMREFKCVEAPTEVFCHVPYPYPTTGIVSRADPAWLEHSLLFMFKTPSEFGAKLWNGIYFKLSAHGQGFVGRAQAVDLNRIATPPAQAAAPPLRPALRDDIATGVRWFDRLTIE